MNLYLIRHSLAENLNYNLKDFDRALTKNGILILNKSIENWKYFLNKIDVIVTSPLVRAVQTAEIISKAFLVEQKVIKENIFSPGSKTSDLIELLNVLNKDDVVIVGHQPDLSIHAQNLCSTGGLNISFSPATLVKIEFERKIRNSAGQLVCLIPPNTHK